MGGQRNEPIPDSHVPQSSQTGVEKSPFQISANLLSKKVVLSKMSIEHI